MKYYLIILFTLWGHLALGQEDFVCLDFEIAQMNNCEEQLEEESLRFCRENFGGAYLAFEFDQNCTQELSFSQRGFVDPEELNRGLTEKLQTVASLMEVLDRKELARKFPKHISGEPVWGSESIDMMIEVFQQLLALKKIFKQRSELEVLDYSSEEVKPFLLSTMEYYQLMIRYMTLEYALRYKLSGDPRQINQIKLDKLHLVLKAPYAYSVLKRINLKAKNLDNDYVEFVVSEQEKVIVEYLSLSYAKTEVEYARLITFLGLRENLNNMWAIDRMVPVDLLNSHEVCGDFHTLNSTRGLDGIASIKENISYEVYHGNLMEALPDLMRKSLKFSLVSSKLKSLLKKFSDKNANFSILLHSLASHESMDLDEYIEETFKLLLQQEALSFVEFFHKNGEYLILPGDPIMERSQLVKILAARVAKIRSKQFKESILSLFPWLSLKDQNMLLNHLSRYQEGRTKHLEVVLMGTFLNYLIDRDVSLYEKSHEANYLKKYEETKNVLISVIPFMNKVQIMNPKSVEELVVLFNSRVASEFRNLGFTLTKDQAANEIFMDLLKSIKEDLPKNEGLSEFNFWEIVYRKLRALAETYEISLTEVPESASEKEVIRPLIAKEVDVELDKYLAKNPELINLLEPSLKKRYQTQWDYLLNITRQEVKENEILQKDIERDEELPAVLSLRETAIELLSLFKLRTLSKSISRKSVSGLFTLPELKAFKEAMINQAYTLAPVLKQVIITKETVKQDVIGPHGEVFPFKEEIEVTRKRTLLKQIQVRGLTKTGELNEDKLEDYFSKVVERAKESMRKNIELICDVNPKHYKSSTEFRKVFRSLGHIRSSLPYNGNLSYSEAARLSKLDKKVSKAIRSKTEAFQEDYVEKGLLILGGVSLIGLAFIGVGFILGASAPVLILSLALGSKALLGSLTFSSTMFGAASLHTYYRLNQQFIEVPAQLKFQRSMVKTQLSSTELYDEEFIKKLEKSNNIDKIITFGLLPLDIYFGRSVIHQVKFKLKSQ